MSHRLTKTVLLCISVMALLSVAVGPITADKTERINQSIDGGGVFLIEYNDTGNVTMETLNSSNTVQSTQQYTAKPYNDRYFGLLDTGVLPETVTKIAVSTEKPGVTISKFNHSSIETVSLSPGPTVPPDPDKYPVSVVTNRSESSRLLLTTGTGFGFVPVLSTGESVPNISVAKEKNGGSLPSSIKAYALTQSQPTTDIEFIQTLYNQTLTTDESVESLRVIQQQGSTVPYGRVQISSNGSTLIDESLNTNETIIGYGAVSLDNYSQYRVRVTGVSEPNNNPQFSVQQIKSNSPIISIGPPGSSSSNTLIWLFVILVAVTLFLRTRR
jgi:hypothetical protein